MLSIPYSPDESLPFHQAYFTKVCALKWVIKSTVLGFVGCALGTLARLYSRRKRLLKTYSNIKGHGIFRSDNFASTVKQIRQTPIATYICHQIDCGAQAVQMFDSWAGQTMPSRLRKPLLLPYQQQVFRKVKEDSSRYTTYFIG